MSRNAVLFVFNEMPIEAKTEALEWLFNWQGAHTPYMTRLDPECWGENHMYAFKFSHEAKAFEEGLKVFLQSFDEYRHLIQMHSVDAPCGRWVATNNPKYGMHVYVQPGDTVLSIEDYLPENRGVYRSVFPKSRILGEIVRVWVMGASGPARKVRNTLRYQLRLDRAGEAHYRFEDAVEAATVKMSKHVAIGVLTKKGDFFQIDHRGVHVNTYDDDTDTIEAQVWDYIRYDLNFGNEANPATVELHGLSPMAMKLRQAAHVAIIQRNHAGYI